MARFTLTVRNGPRVTREGHESLDAAVTAMRERLREVRAEGGLPEVTMLRTFEPDKRVKARLEISSGGWLRRGREAGIDVMGDGSIVPFRGGAFRRPLGAAEGDDPMVAVEAALRQ